MALRRWAVTAPILELRLSVHSSLPAIAIEVPRSKIINASQIDQNISILQSAMIDCPDLKLCRTKSITESALQKTFVPGVLAAIPAAATDH
jgi:hypothetical protein